MDIFTVIILIWFLSTPAFILLWVFSRRREKRLKVSLSRYSGIQSLEEEQDKKGADLREIEASIVELKATYIEKRDYLRRLTEKVAIYDERLAFAELGVYEPHFDFGDSATFKEEIGDIRAQQKEMVAQKAATICPTDWTVDGSVAKGQTMINRQSRLTLRAFNNECEAAIANTRWNNALAMERRILNAEKALAKANASMNLTLSGDYVDLKIEELRLTHEYREQLKIEKDERAELARSEREERKLQADARAAEREEQRYQALLEKAKMEAGVGEVGDELRQKIRNLEAALEEAHTHSERARAMAEMTKTGYVYIISNVGSFGEDMVKIGMTRRLDPSDRVRELGDASVPFRFDTHAMVFSEEAPTLEAALHKEFSESRVNMANMRKEFFRVSLEDVEKAVARLAPDAEFFLDREAQEYHETIARRNEKLANLQADLADELPDSI